jgi:hypothetical protein
VLQAKSATQQLKDDAYLLHDTRANTFDHVQPEDKSAKHMSVSEVMDRLNALFTEIVARASAASFSGNDTDLSETVLQYMITLSRCVVLSLCSCL